jgi:hypothetical protein
MQTIEFACVMVAFRIAFAIGGLGLASLPAAIVHVQQIRLIVFVNGHLNLFDKINCKLKLSLKTYKKLAKIKYLKISFMDPKDLFN